MYVFLCNILLYMTLRNILLYVTKHHNGREYTIISDYSSVLYIGIVLYEDVCACAGCCVFSAVKG